MREATGYKRSPNYPQLNIEESLQFITNIIENSPESRKMSRVDFAKQLSISPTSGKLNLVLSALNHYNFIKKNKDDIHISELALSIVATFGKDGIVTTLVEEAFYSVEIFRKLRDIFRTSVSDNLAVQSWLRDEGYSDDGITKVIGIYQDNIEYLIALNHQEYDYYSKNKMANPSSLNLDGDNIYNFQLSKSNRVTVKFINPPNKKELGMMIKNINLLLEALDE